MLGLRNPDFFNKCVGLVWPIVEDKFFTPHGIILLATRTTSILSWILGKFPLKPKRAHIIYLILMESGFSNNSPYLHKTTSKPMAIPIKTHGSSSWHIISLSKLMNLIEGNFGSCSLEDQEICSIKLQQFKVDKRNMLLVMSFPISWTLTCQCVIGNIW